MNPSFIPATKWTRYIKDKTEWVWEFNHIEDGHSSTSLPLVKFPSQDGWKRSKWQKELAWLTNEVPPKLVTKEHST